MSRHFFDQLNADVPLHKYPSMLGFDDFVLRAKEHMSRKDNTYPPHNVIKIGNNYIIEFALAGFKREQIDISLTERLLTVAAESVEAPPAEGYDFIHKGIAKRSFSKQFLLNDNIDVTDAQMADGLLRVFLAERKKPTRKISVGGGWVEPVLNTQPPPEVLLEDPRTPPSVENMRLAEEISAKLDAGLDEYAALEDDPIAKSDELVSMTPPRQASYIPDEILQSDELVQAAANAISTHRDFHLDNTGKMLPGNNIILKGK